jgi:hypothetical protein
VCSSDLFRKVIDADDKIIDDIDLLFRNHAQSPSVCALFRVFTTLIERLVNNQI